MMFDECLAVVLPHATRPESELHGVEHWRRVAQNGADLAAATPGADADVVAAFAALHDSQRLNEHVDPEHGTRAAWVASLLDLGLAPKQRRTLNAALLDHDRGLTSDDPTIGCCWDADRLDLDRLGIQVDPAKLSTDVGKAWAETEDSVRSWWERLGVWGRS